jgi:hypothetical protein
MIAWAGRNAAALLALIAAILGFWNKRKISELHVIVNSRLSELLVTAQRASHAEGVEAGRKENILERKDRP